MRPPSVTPPENGPYTGQAFTAAPAFGNDDVNTKRVRDFEDSPLIVAYYRGGNVSGKPRFSPPTEAGRYLAVASFAGNKNYNSADSKPVAFEITRAKPTVHTDAHKATYTGSPIPIKGTVTGVDGRPVIKLDGAEVTVVYDSDPPTGAWSVNAPTDIGNYTAKACFPGSKNYDEAFDDPRPFEIVDNWAQSPIEDLPRRKKGESDPTPQSATLCQLPEGKESGSFKLLTSGIDFGAGVKIGLRCTDAKRHEWTCVASKPGKGEANVARLAVANRMLTFEWLPASWPYLDTGDDWRLEQLRNCVLRVGNEDLQCDIALRRPNSNNPPLRLGLSIGPQNNNRFEFPTKSVDNVPPRRSWRIEIPRSGLARSLWASPKSNMATRPPWLPSARTHVQCFRLL